MGLGIGADPELRMASKGLGFRVWGLGSPIRMNLNHKP